MDKTLFINRENLACTQYDILLRKEDPCSDCEPLRYQSDIANAMQGYYDLIEALRETRT